MISPSFEREAIVTMPSCRCAWIDRNIRPCQSAKRIGAPRALRSRNRSKWIRSTVSVARWRETAAPASRERIARATLPDGRRRDEKRTDLLVDPRNDSGHGAHALGECGDHEVRAAGKEGARDEVVVVV